MSEKQDSDLIKDKDTYLENLLKDLSKDVIDGNNCDKVFDAFRELYSSNDYRHQYSKFYVIVKFNTDNSTLSENLQLISTEAQKRYEANQLDPNTYKSIRKIQDHINLEIARYDDLNGLIANEKNLQEKIDDAQSNYKKLAHETSQINETAENTSKRIEKNIIDVVSALSLFSAVIISFFGGFSFISSAMAGMKDTPILKIFLVVISAGFIVINLIFIILYFIAKIINRSLSITCLKKNIDDCNACEKPCNSFFRLKRKLPYIFWINVILFIAFLPCLVFYFIKA